MKIRTATTAETPAELLNDLRSLLHDAELMLNPAPGGSSGEPMTSPHPRFRAMQHSKILLAGTKAALNAGVKYADVTIRTNPYRSVAIALGAGLLAGVLLGRGK